MMIKKRKGFSLAEVLVTLMIVGIVSAAAIPTIARQAITPDKLWAWADQPVGSIYYTGNHVLLDSGIASKSLSTMSVDFANLNKNYFPDAKDELINSGKNLTPKVFVPFLDKMIIFNNQADFYIDEGEIASVENIQKSHIGFYNILNASSATPYEYAGRLAADNTNLVLGIGGLQHSEPNETTKEGMYNTSIGHYNLMTNVHSSDITAIGRYVLPSFSGLQSSPAAFNVAVGNRAQLKNRYGKNNTAVGYNAMNAVIGSSTAENGDYNLALGVNALASKLDKDDNSVVNKYNSKNIALGANAGFDKATSDGQIDGKVLEDKRSAKSYRLFLGDANVQSLESKIWHNEDTGYISDSEFNINADEIIVNTADGTHTILKIRMIDDTGVELPVMKGDHLTYAKLNYCAGEGSADLKNISNNKLGDAVADVCIAKFKDVKRVIPTYQEYKGIFKNETEIYTDWDIFMKSVDVGFDSGVMTGGNTHAGINTVKSALNYIEMHKEGQGILSSAVDAFVQNLKCFLTYFTGASSCDNLDVGYQRNFVAEVKAWFRDRIRKVCDAVNFLGLLPCSKYSDVRLKNVSGVSTAGLKEINTLKVKNYTFKDDKNKTPHVGVIAQELQKVFPNSVVEGSDGYLRIKQDEMFYAMVNSIKELDKLDKELKKELPEINKQIKAVVDKNKALVEKNEQLKAKKDRLNAQLKILEANK